MSFMRYIILAILIYLAYLVIKSFFRSASKKDKNKVTGEKKDKSRRSYDVNRIEDAEFREVKKD